MSSTPSAGTEETDEGMRDQPVLIGCAEGIPVTTDSIVLKVRNGWRILILTRRPNVSMMHLKWHNGLGEFEKTTMNPEKADNRLGVSSEQS